MNREGGLRGLNEACQNSRGKLSSSLKAMDMERKEVHRHG